MPSGQPSPGSDKPSSRAEARSLWSEAYGPLPVELRSREPGIVLIQLENSLLKRLIRLQEVESRLWRTVSHRRGKAGQRAVRQIERERRRLGRELHTGVGQLLAAIRIQLELVANAMPNPPAP